jgi:hypothetical protein
MTDTPRVSNVKDALRFLLDQYGDRIARADSDDARAVLAELDEWDARAEERRLMLDRRLAVLQKRLQEGEVDTRPRPDLHWVKAEIAALTWVKGRM